MTVLAFMRSTFAGRRTSVRETRPKPQSNFKEFWTSVAGLATLFIGVLAHLQLGRAQVILGDKVAARKSYNDFLTRWKDADPDIPIYIQAKAEYARRPR